MSLLSELTRRSVFKIGVAYAIVAWLLMQVASLAVPVLLLPDWVTTFVVFLLVLGFPIALILAWAYEVTPDGIKKTKDVPLEQSIGRIKGRKLDFFVIGLLVVAVAVLIVDRFNVRQSSDSTAVQVAEQTSIAVLPFDNMSDDPSQEHFADGLTEELLNSLAAIDNLRVISRTSSFSFKGQNKAISEIAASLGANHILEGSVRRAGNRVRVTAQLIDTGSDSHLWSENYDRELTVNNILDIQEEVATMVADALHAQLRPDERESLKPDGPANLGALDLYHEGMYFVRQMEIGNLDFLGEDSFKAAKEKFEGSIAADPDWAPAHSGLGRVYHFWMHIGDKAEQLRGSRQHIMEAIRLDPTFGPSYTSLGFIDTMEGDYDNAFVALERARELGAPGNWWGWGILLRRLYRYEEAIDVYRKAVANDPLSLTVKYELMNTLYCADRPDEILKLADELFFIEPDNLDARLMLAYANVRAGDNARGLQLADDVAKITGTDATVAITFALGGERDRAHAAIEEGEPVESWWSIAPAAIVLGETSVAIDILEQIERERPLQLGANIRCAPQFRNLAGNPRYDALLERLDLLN